MCRNTSGRGSSKYRSRVVGGLLPQRLCRALQVALQADGKQGGIVGTQAAETAQVTEARQDGGAEFRLQLAAEGLTGFVGAVDHERNDLHDLFGAREVV